MSFEVSGDDELTLSLNGVNGATGEYLLGPLGFRDVAAIAKGESLEAAHIRELKLWWERMSVDHLGPVEGVDPTDLSEAGWGLVFPASSDPAICPALRPLIELRRQQVGPDAGHRFRVFADADGVQPGESKTRFLARHGVGFGPADPDRMPYYLLLVGDPEEIPYRFQYELDVTYAVGRIHFGTIDEYVRYAENIVAAETSSALRPPRAAFVGVRNDGDRATRLSADHLIRPLVAELVSEQDGWTFDTRLGNEAGKAAFGEVLGGNRTPALLFTASHGMGFPRGHPRQLPDQGALLCQDWPGPVGWCRPIPAEFYFSATDVGDDARLDGLIAVMFACYGAGTPRLDDFAHQALRAPTAVAPHAFVARLPQRLLTHPAGGSLAVVGHVERAWGYSFVWPGVGQQFGAIKNMLVRLLNGYPVGYAMEYLNQRYAELSTVLSAELEEVKWGKRADDRELAGMWSANNDARSYVVIGDPAVRLSVTSP
jgi:hypothetical protein